MPPDIRVMIVEDEPIIAQNIERNLRYLGYSCPGVASGAEEARELLRQERPDVVLMDIHLEGPLDGVDLASEIQRVFGIPVVYLSGLMDEETLERAKITQPFGYIAKPYTRRELQITLEIAVYKSQVEARLREQELRIEQLLETMQQGFCFLGADGHVVNANRRFISLLGASLEEVQARHFTEFVAEEDRRQVAAYMSSPGPEYERPHRIDLLDGKGQKRPVIIVPKIVRDRAGYRGCFLSLTEFPEA